MDLEIMVKIEKPSLHEILNFDKSSATLSQDETITSTAKVANKRYLLDDFTSKQKEYFTKIFQFQLRTDTAKLPQQGTPNSIGFDIACDRSTMVSSKDIHSSGMFHPNWTVRSYCLTKQSCIERYHCSRRRHRPWLSWQDYGPSS